MNEEVNFKFYLILTDLYRNNTEWLIATLLAQGGRRAGRIILRKVFLARACEVKKGHGVSDNFPFVRLVSFLKPHFLICMWHIFLKTKMMHFFEMRTKLTVLENQRVWANQ